MGFPMAYVIQTSRTASRPATSLGVRLWAGLSAWLDRTIHAMSRRDQVEALMALSDADLAARGLTRDGIVAHVFRDRLGF